jgi:hypothetical protein
VVVLEHEDEQWVPDHGEAVGRSVIHDDRPMFPTPEDRADYEKAGPGPPSGGSQTYALEDIDVAGLSLDEVRALPTEPAALKAKLAGREVDLTAIAGRLLGLAFTPPDVKAALYGVLKSLPGATLVPDAKDPKGRTGVGVEFSTEAWKTLFLFDPETGALLATRSIGSKEVKDRKIDDWSLMLESGRRDDAPRPAR